MDKISIALVISLVSLMAGLGIFGCSPGRELIGDEIAMINRQSISERRVESRERNLAEIEILNRQAAGGGAESASPDGPYRLKIGDLLEVSVFDEPSMTKEVAVLPDGSVSYLLVGDLPAGGRTIAELREDIEQRLGKYFREPKVSVIPRKVLQESASPVAATVLGAVNSPGKYEMSLGDTVVDLVARSGGFLFATQDFQSGSRQIANLKASYVSRGGRRLPVDLYALFEEGRLEYNVKLANGDLLYVAGSDSEQVFVLGEVNLPRAITYNREVSLVEAITKSGGFTERAQRGKVMILRGDRGEDHFFVDIESLLLGEYGARNLALRHGDIVFVPEQGLSEYSRYARYFNDFAVLLLNITNIYEAVVNHSKPNVIYRKYQGGGQ